MIKIHRLTHVACLALVVTFAAAMPLHAAGVSLVIDGKPVGHIAVDTRGAHESLVDVMQGSAAWLAEAIEEMTGAALPVTDDSAGASVVVGLAAQYPDAARKVALDADNFDAFAIITEPNRILLLGATEPGTHHAVAHLLHHLGVRYYNPMPNWWIHPQRKTITVDLTLADKPALAARRIWYAYGVREQLLKDGYSRWSRATKQSSGGRYHTGHSYGHIIGRNKDAFEAHPEYYNLRADGTRQSAGHPNARKLCVSNEGLIQLVIEDRKKLLAESRKTNPYAFMVSVDPSDGEGACLCDNCAAIGTTTDRVFHLANRVAKALAQESPPGWVGLYAYSSHRMPATIDVEPNVYVQVALGFNKTPYTLPQLVEKWSEKVTSIGLREYYGVEAWDWGLPGRMRGARSGYHAKWIPYYAKRNLNAINAETNANWGAQTLGLNVAAALMWNPQADADAIADDYFTQAFGSAAPAMRKLQDKFDQAPPLRGATLRPLFEDIQEAYDTSDDPAVRARVIDMMSYAHYLTAFRAFTNVRAAQPSRDDTYYDALKPLMQYAWQTRMRGMVHYYALTRRLCNGLPRQDNRMDFYFAAKDPLPVWMAGEQLTDEQIIALFNEDLTTLKTDDDPNVVFSNYLEHVTTGGEDAGPSSVLRTHEGGVMRVSRNGINGWIASRGETPVTLRILAQGKQSTVTVKRRDDVIHEEVVAITEEPVAVTFTLPKAGEHSVNISGSVVLWVDPQTPFVYEQSMLNRSQIEYSGPHYFYIPKGTTELIVEPGTRLSLQVPGEKKRRDITPADCAPGKSYAIIPVPEDTDGTVWHTTNMTRGSFALLNVPPLLSLHRHTVITPREVAESDELVTASNP